VKPGAPSLSCVLEAPHQSPLTSAETKPISINTEAELPLEPKRKATSETKTETEAKIEPKSTQKPTKSDQPKPRPKLLVWDGWDGTGHDARDWDTIE